MNLLMYWEYFDRSQERLVKAREAAERGLLDIVPLARKHGQLELAMSVLTASELLHGVHRADTRARRARREAYVETILSTFPVVPFDLICARTHA